MSSEFEVFISHIHEESGLALVVKDWIESTFAGRLAVFVGCGGKDIPSGAKWLEKIDDAVRSSKLLLVLCSPVSILRPWINFEIGCAWNKRIRVIPICHSGLRRDSLPQPLCTFQALNLEGLEFPKNLFESIAQLFNIPKIPRIIFSEMENEISEAIKTISIPNEEGLIGIYLRNKSEVDSALLDLVKESRQTLKATGGKSRIVSYLEEIAENLDSGKIRAYHRLITGDHITHELHEHLEPLIDHKGSEFRWNSSDKYGNISISENQVVFVLPSPYPDDYTGFKLSTESSAFFYSEFFNRAFNSEKSIRISTRAAIKVLCEKCSPGIAHDADMIRQLLLR